MAFKYINKELSISQGDKSLRLNSLLPKDEPFYVYDLAGMTKRLNDFKNAFTLKNLSIHYAFKANANKTVLSNFAEQGIGIDVVSMGEMKLAFEAGFKPKDVVFSGVAKTKAELKFAINKQIKQINVECPEELSRIGEVARGLNKKAVVAFRMNPDVAPETHPYICTGFRDNKFGMDQSFLPELRRILTEYKDSIEFVGLSMHIGSQIRETKSFLEAIQKTLVVYKSLKREGWPLKTLDIGGGLGMSYESFDCEKEDLKLINQYGAEISELLKDFDDEVMCEPGRILVARYGALLSEVQYIKQTPYKKFVIVNTGMHHLLRPSLYQAYHNIFPLFDEPKTELYDVVGPICESSDVLGNDRSLPVLKSGDWLCVLDTGAYGRTMASNYNFHALPEEVIITEADLK